MHLLMIKDFQGMMLIFLKQENLETDMHVYRLIIKI